MNVFDRGDDLTPVISHTADEIRFWFPVVLLSHFVFCRGQLACSLSTSSFATTFTYQSGSSSVAYGVTISHATASGPGATANAYIHIFGGSPLNGAAA